MQAQVSSSSSPPFLLFIVLVLGSVKPCFLLTLLFAKLSQFIGVRCWGDVILEEILRNLREM